MVERLVKGENTGYIPYVPSGTDYIKGENSPLGAAIPVFDYRLARPVLDLQKKNGFESYGCVSWAACQDIEEMINAMRQLGALPQTHESFLLKNGYIINDLVVFSKSYIWILSNTQDGIGNDFKTVATTIKNYGLIPSVMLPFDPLPRANWYDVFKTPTAEMQRMGKEFNQYFDTKYHFITDKNYTTHLNDGPIQIAIPICPGYNTDTPIKACGLSESHSVIMDHVDPQNQKDTVDHYNPEIKKLSSDYIIYAAMQYVVTINEVNKPMYEKVATADGKTYGVRISTPDSDTIIYVTQGVEQWKGWSKPDSYGIHTVNPDGTPDFTGCTVLPWNI